MNHDDALRFDSEAFALAQARVKSAPLDLTASDFDQLGIVSKTLETDAYEARRLAQLAIVQSHQTKSAAPTSRSRSLTLEQLDAMAGAVVDTIQKALEQPKADIEALKARVLELEAEAAASRPTVDHADG